MSKITESAKGETCTVRVPVCNYRPETTVFAHLNGAGMAIKSLAGGLDLGCYACSDCHAWLDGGYVKTDSRETRDLEHYRATVETIARLIDKGLITFE